MKTLTKKSKDAEKAREEEIRSELSNIVKEESTLAEVCNDLVPRVFVLDFHPGMQQDGSTPFKKPQNLRKVRYVYMDK